MKKTPTQNVRNKQQRSRNPRASLIPVLKRTTNPLRQDSENIVFESPSPMTISPVTEEIELSSPDTKSSIESAEILDYDLLVSPSTDENLVFSTDSYLSDSSEVTNYTVDSTPAKSEQSEMSSATEIFKNLEFADDSTLSAPSGIVSPNESPAISETSKALRIARIAELLKQRRQKKKTQKDEEMMRMVELLKRYGTDSNRLQSLTEIGGTSLEDDICELRCTKERIGIFYFVIWLCLVLVILFWKSSASSGVSSSVYRIPPLT